MARRKNNTGVVLAVAGAGVLAYLIFHRKATTTTPGLAPPGSPYAGLPAQGINLFQSLSKFFTPAASGPNLPSTLPTTQAGQAALTAVTSSPQSLAPTDLPGAAPSPASIAPMQLTTGPSDLFPVTTPADNIDASAYLDESTIAGVYDWPGYQKGVFTGRNQPMSVYQEIPGTMIAALAGIGCLSCIPRRAVIGKFDWEQLIIPGAVLIGGYYLIKKTGLFSGPITGTGQANAQTQAATAAANDASLKNAQNQGIVQTLTSSQLASLANDIYTQGLKDPPNQDQIQRDIIQANTLTDLLQMIKSFDTRPANTGSWLSLCALANIQCTSLDMATFVRLVLDQAHIQTVNGYLSDTGINYQF
jgi:hypothetical protein